jgi:hypothetical protein
MAETMDKKIGKNLGVWYGEMVGELEFSHEVKERSSGKIIERFLRCNIRTEILNKRGEMIDSSIIPVTVSENKINELAKRPEAGDILFLKGSWRAYDYKKGAGGKTKLEQTAYAKFIELHTSYQMKVRNKFDFEGVLVRKLYECEREENGKPKKDQQNRLIPRLDENGAVKYTVRKNKEGKVVNDITIAVNRPNGSDYLPAIAYKKLAVYISKQVDIYAEVEGSGYIRSRNITKNGIEEMVYEVVVTQLNIVGEEPTKEENE